MPFTGGLPETLCGAGSTEDYTAGIRKRLPGLLADLGVKVILDAPCGDFNWMAKTDLSKFIYCGVDYDIDHVIAARIRKSEPEAFSPKAKIVMKLDVVQALLPEADIMICRDFMQHIPTEMIEAVLSNMRSSNIEWFLLTSHINQLNKDIRRPGMFRPINLMKAPFFLPRPKSSIDDGEGRALGLWTRECLIQSRRHSTSRTA